MAYDEKLANRVRTVLKQRKVSFDTLNMMGGLCFMVDGKMCLGVTKLRLMVRLDPEQIPEALTQPGCKPMDFTGRPLKGFVFVEPEGTKSERQFLGWIGLALEYNPRAKASRKRSAPKR